MLTASSYAKWILSGEHAVIRGKKAIVFPLRQFSTTVTFTPGDELIINGDTTGDTIISLLKRAEEFLSCKSILGTFSVAGNIPIKAGLGSSASVCVSIANILSQLGLCKDIFELARYLENKFHKISSGLDIAVTLKNKPIVFQNNKISEIFEPQFWPNMILTYSGQMSSTSACTQKIHELFQSNHDLAIKLDESMDLASSMCEQAFKKANFDLLKDGINLCNDIFRSWGLCDSKLQEHIDYLYNKGAVAVKPIGSGLGGYVLSLWNENPEKYIDKCLTLIRP